MKICPFISHMLGEDRADVLQIDSPVSKPEKATGSPGEHTDSVVILGYDVSRGRDMAVGVATEPEHDSTVPTHLHCLKDTCRFFQKNTGGCKFDSLFDELKTQSDKIAGIEEQTGKIDGLDEHAARFDSVEKQLKKIDSIERTVNQTGPFERILEKIADVEKQVREASESAGDETGADQTEARIIRELDKFWKFQTKSVSEMISSIGEAEKKQNNTLSDFQQKLLESTKNQKPEGDQEQLDEIRQQVRDLKDAVESREDGIDNFSTTISELFMNLDDTLKKVLEKNETLAQRISELESAFPKSENIQESIQEALNDKLTLWTDNLGSIEEKQAEMIRLFEKDTNSLDAESPVPKKREAKKFNNLGVTSFHNGELELARDQFLEAVTLDPQFAEAWNNLGLVYTELENNDEATHAFGKTVEINPELPAAYNNLGYIYYRQENYDKAVKMYKEALERSPDNSSACTNLGNAYFKQGKPEDARSAWEKALEIDPGNEKASRNLKRLDKE
jgi:Flp pilus assembly protein TadD